MTAGEAGTRNQDERQQDDTAQPSQMLPPRHQGDQIVIGSRSALFAPVQQLGLIVIDECHEPSFKQEQSPRYSALRAASILTRQHNAKLILGSATPAVADYYLAKHSNSAIASMTAPARTDAIKPSITLVDMTKRQNFSEHQFL